MNTFKFHIKRIIFNKFTCNSQKVASFAKQTSYVQHKNPDHDTCVPGININRVAQNKNLTYFTVGFSVISLTINKPILEIHLESMQHRLKCLIITGRSKVTPIVLPKKQLRSCHTTKVIGLQKYENNSLP